MGVYLYPSGTETELKNAYIGEYTEWRQPWANTIAYFPFMNDIQDKVWTATITTGVTPTKASVWFTFTSSSTGNYTTVDGANFWSIRAKANSLNSNYIGLLNARDGYVGYYYKHIESNLNKRFYMFYNSSLSRVSSNQTSVWTWARHHFCYWNNNGAWTFFLDGTQFYTQSTRQPYSSSGKIYIVWIGDGSDTFEISDLIVESVARTAQEIANYYNQTKSNYWL
jgi:hypothetical protein